MGEPTSLRRYTNVMSALDTLAKKHIMLTTTAGWADVNDNLSIEEYRKASGCKSVLAVCMTEAYETFHHWGIFAAGQTGLYIQLNREKFCNLVENDKNLLAGKVRYLGLPEIRTVRGLPQREIPFLKRSGFKDEMEYRVIARSDDAECKAIPVTITIDMIEKIVFSPFIPEALVNSTKLIMNAIEGCDKLKIGQSKLTTNVQWLNHINRLLSEAA
jgi:hypothetical protein